MRIRTVIPVIAASLALLGGMLVLASPALAYLGTTSSGMMGDNMSMMWFGDEGKMFGIISSLQNNETGEPGWMVTGHWMMTNKTEDGSTNITDFYAGFHMIMLDGTAGHTHEIYDFAQDSDSVTDNTTTITGTSTVTMREDPVEDVPTEITISNGKVIAISLDPEALDNHFGDTPIYGMVITPEILQHMMNATAVSSFMGDHEWRGNQTGTASEMWK